MTDLVTESITKSRKKTTVAVKREILSSLVAKLGKGKVDEKAAFEFFKAFKAGMAVRRK